MMTFSYAYDLANDTKDRVRYEIADTGAKDENGTLIADSWFLEDEEISALLTIYNDDYQQASLDAIRAIIGKLSRPAFTADWLKVDPKVAIDSYRKLYHEKASQYGISLGESGSAWFESGSTDVVRGDVVPWDADSV